MAAPATGLDREALVGVVGAAYVSDAGSPDAVDGVEPAVVVEPGTIEEASEVLRLASAGGLRVTPRGTGTELGLGMPPDAMDVVLSTRRLDAIVEHAAGDLVVTAQAGVPLAALQATVAEAGQQLALDPPDPSATLGGIVAANTSGPRRLRSGTVRDLIIGITVVLADGTVARAGGKVVKNVAGYDLAKLFTGSLGTLGLVAQATFRLHPRPAARRAARVELATGADAAAAVQLLLRAPLVPSFAELEQADGGAPVLTVLFEGIEPGVAAQADACAALLGRVGAATVEPDASLPPLPDGEVLVKLAHVPSALATVLDGVREVAGRHGLRTAVRGHAATGITRVGLGGGDAGAYAGFVEDVRPVVAPEGGSAVVVRAPLAVKAALDVWGPVGDALPLMRRVKQQYDPAGTMSPGRFAGGI